MKNKAVLIVVGACVVVMGLAAWSLLAFFLVRSGILFPDKVSSFGIRFGILDFDSSNNIFLAKETTVIPLKLKDTGFEYGVMIVPPDDKPFTYQLVFHFSAPPKIISGDGFESNTPSATMRTPIYSAHGTTYADYVNDPGDPLGAESIDVFINGQLATTIKYTMVPPDQAAGGT